MIHEDYDLTEITGITHTSDKVVRLIIKEPTNVNNQISSVENIRKFRLLDKKLYTEEGEVTPTMKVKRKSISKEFKYIIEEKCTKTKSNPDEMVVIAPLRDCVAIANIDCA